MLFLALFSFVLLVDYFPLNTYGERRSHVKYLPLPITEIILHIFIWSLIFEEIYQFIWISEPVKYVNNNGKYFKVRMKAT